MPWCHTPHLSLEHTLSTTTIKTHPHTHTSCSLHTAVPSAWSPPSSGRWDSHHLFLPLPFEILWLIIYLLGIDLLLLWHTPEHCQPRTHDLHTAATPSHTHSCSNGKHVQSKANSLLPLCWSAANTHTHRYKLDLLPGSSITVNLYLEKLFFCLPCKSLPLWFCTSDPRLLYSKSSSFFCLFFPLHPLILNHRCIDLPPLPHRFAPHPLPPTLVQIPSSPLGPTVSHGPSCH